LVFVSYLTGAVKLKKLHIILLIRNQIIYGSVASNRYQRQLIEPQRRFKRKTIDLGYEPKPSLRITWADAITPDPSFNLHRSAS